MAKGLESAAIYNNGLGRVRKSRQLQRGLTCGLLFLHPNHLKREATRFGGVRALFQVARESITTYYIPSDDAQIAASPLSEASTPDSKLSVSLTVVHITKRVSLSQIT